MVVLEPHTAQEPPLTVGRIVVRPDRHEATVDGEPVTLTLTQFSLLVALARRPGWVVTPEQFDRRLAKPGHTAGVGTRAVKHHVAALRRALGPAAPQLQTIRGHGYRLVEWPTAPATVGPPVRVDQDQAEC